MELKKLETVFTQLIKSQMDLCEDGHLSFDVPRKYEFTTQKRLRGEPDREYIHSSQFSPDS